MTAVTAPATDAARIGPPAGWDPDEAAERIRRGSARVAELHAAVGHRRPLWTYGEVEQVVQWLTRPGRR